MTYRELKKLLEANGFELVRMKRHHIFKRGVQKIPVPFHQGKDIGKGLLHDILKQAGIKPKAGG